MPLSEDALIARYLAPLAGPEGLRLEDDAASIAPTPGQTLVVSKDLLVAGVHLFPQDPPGLIARKALRVNLSDLAAKAAVPRGFFLGLALPTDVDDAWIAAFAEGLAEDVRQFACPLLGGDTVATPGPLTISITVLGETERMVPRGGARPGDMVYISGTIGDAALGLDVRRRDLSLAAADWTGRLAAGDAAFLADRYLLPVPRLDLRDALSAHASAAMDVSDGLIGDLGKMLRLGGATAALSLDDVPLSPAVRAALRLDPSLVRHVVTGGDDYEVLATVPAVRAAAFEAAARAAGVPVTRLGEVTSGSGPVTLRDGDGHLLDLGPGAYQHGF